MDLFEDRGRREEKKLTLAVREINLKYGRSTVACLSAGTQKREKQWFMRREMLSPCYTTRIADFPVVYAK